MGLESSHTPGRVSKRQGAPSDTEREKVKGIERSLWGLLITQPSRMYRCVPVRINRGGEGKRGPTERVIKESAAYGKDKCK